MTSNNIKVARINAGLSVDEISRKLDITPQAYYNYEKGNREPSSDTLIKLSLILNVSVDYLLGVDNNVAPIKAPLTAGAKIKVLGKVPAGVPIEAVEYVIDEIEISEKMTNDSHDYFALLVTGDSMSPEYLDGDTVIVRKQSDADTNDDVIAFVNGNDATFKRLQKTDKGIRLRAINPAYDSYFYTNEQIKNLPISILGVVVEMRRTRK